MKHEIALMLWVLFITDANTRKESIPSAVKRLITSDPFLRKRIELGIISHTRIAGSLGPSIEAHLRNNVSLPAVKIAISRLMGSLISREKTIGKY